MEDGTDEPNSEAEDGANRPNVETTTTDPNAHIPQVEPNLEPNISNDGIVPGLSLEESVSEAYQCYFKSVEKAR